MISTATVIAFVCVFTFFKSQSVSENALVRGIIGFTQSTLSMSKRFTIAFWSTILYMRKLEVFVFEMILGPFTFIIVSIQLLLYFDYVWQFYFLFSIYNCIFLSLPYYFWNSQKYPGIINSTYFKIVSLLYLILYCFSYLSIFCSFFSIIVLMSIGHS